MTAFGWQQYVHTMCLKLKRQSPGNLRGTLFILLINPLNFKFSKKDDLGTGCFYRNTVFLLRVTYLSSIYIETLPQQTDRAMKLKRPGFLFWIFFPIRRGKIRGIKEGPLL